MHCDLACGSVRCHVPDPLEGILVHPLQTDLQTHTPCLCSGSASKKWVSVHAVVSVALKRAWNQSLTCGGWLRSRNGSSVIIVSLCTPGHVWPASLKPAGSASDCACRFPVSLLFTLCALRACSLLTLLDSMLPVCLALSAALGPSNRSLCLPVRPEYPATCPWLREYPAWVQWPWYCCGQKPDWNSLASLDWDSLAMFLIPQSCSSVAAIVILQCYSRGSGTAVSVVLL